MFYFSRRFKPGFIDSSLMQSSRADDGLVRRIRILLSMSKMDDCDIERSSRYVEIPTCMRGVCLKECKHWRISCKKERRGSDWLIADGRIQLALAKGTEAGCIAIRINNSERTIPEVEMHCAADQPYRDRTGQHTGPSHMQSSSGWRARTCTGEIAIMRIVFLQRNVAVISTSDNEKHHLGNEPAVMAQFGRTLSQFLITRRLMDI